MINTKLRQSYSYKVALKFEAENSLLGLSLSLLKRIRLLKVRGMPYKALVVDVRGRNYQVALFITKCCSQHVKVLWGFKISM